MVGDSMRIGDSERDEAVSMLQEHHAAGRLSTEEFDERMGKALEARTASDLVGLFFDLPAPRPGLDLAAQPQPQPEPVVAPWAGAPQAPATWGADDDQLQHRPMARPWFAQWWIILPFVIMGTRGIWWIIPMVALWIWVIWPAIEQNRQRQQVAAAPMRPLTLEERDQVLFALRTGSETAAIKRYRELTGADLYTATMTVKAMQRELGR
ncbi:MAG: DUF1707 domain-containing protein [Propionibacteriaceae bacterium]|nr:DUF1707 domain-containing protein [Propionibacteriaceae bacterium]